MPVLHPNPIVDLGEPRDTRSFADLLSGLFNDLSTAEMIKQSVVGDPDREAQMAYAAKMRALRRFGPRPVPLIGGDGKPILDEEGNPKVEYRSPTLPEALTEDEIRRLGDAKQPFTLPTPFDPMSGFSARELEMLAQLHPEAVRQAEVDFYTNLQVSPEDVARGAAAEEKAKIFEAEYKVEAAERQRNVQRLLNEKFPEDEEARYLFTQISNAIEEEAQRTRTLGITGEVLDRAARFVEAMSTTERAFFDAGNLPGTEGLIQYWLQELRFEFQAHAERIANAKSIEELVEERGKRRAWFQGRIAEISEQARTAIDSNRDEEARRHMNSLRAEFRDLMFIDPTVGYAELDVVRGLLGPKDFEEFYHEVTPELFNTLDSISTDLANDSKWTPKVDNDVMMRVRELPILLDPLTGEVDEARVAILVELAMEKRTGVDRRGQAEQQAAREAMIIGRLGQSQIDELNDAEERLTAMREEGRHTEAVKFEWTVLRLRLRNFFLKGMTTAETGAVFGGM